MKLSNDELEDKVDRYKEKIENFTGMWDEIPEERRKTLFAGLGQRTRAVGIYSILRGDVSEGNQWLEEAADWYLKAWKHHLGEENEVQHFMWALLTSVLSMKQELMATTAGKIDSVEFEDPTYFYQFNIVLAELIRRQDDRVLEAAEELEALEDGGAPSRLTYYGGLSEACRGIAIDDPELFDEGLSVILKRHEALVPTLGETMDDALVCYPATVLLILAAERGIPVQDLERYGNHYILWDLIEES